MAVACAGDGKSDAALLSTRMVGDEVFVDAARVDLYYWTCMGEPTLQKQVGAEWVSLRDDRPPGWNSPGYFLDGQYLAPSMNLGCDYITCNAFGETHSIARAVEHVKVGTRAKPASAPANAPSPVDMIERRPLSGALRARLTYSTSSDCAASTEEFVPITVPEQGVCCPIGDAQCSSEGPGGGWAPTLDACRPWSTTFDVAYQVINDPHDCPTLDYDHTICCGCIPTDTDAGM